MFTQMNGGIMRMAKLDYKYGAGEYLKSMNSSAEKYKLFASSNSNGVSLVDSNFSYGSEPIFMSLISLNSLNYDSLVNSFASNSSYDYSRKSDVDSTNSNVDKIQMMQDIIAKFKEKKKSVVKSVSVSKTSEGSNKSVSKSVSITTGQSASDVKSVSKSVSISLSQYFSKENMRSEFNKVRNVENDIISDSPIDNTLVNTPVTGKQNKPTGLNTLFEETPENSQYLNEDTIKIFRTLNQELFNCLTNRNESSGKIDKIDKIDIENYKYIVEITFDNKSAIPKRIKMFKRETYQNNQNNQNDSHSIKDFLVGHIKNKKRGTNFSKNNETTTMAFYYKGDEKNAECLLFEVPINNT